LQSAALHTYNTNTAASSHILSTPSSPLSTLKQQTAALLANPDTGATGNFFAYHDLPGLVDVKPATCPLSVTLPDGSIMYSTHTALLNILELPLEARRCHVFPALNATGSLLSIGKLCDHGCIAIYDKDSVQIYRSGTLLMQGHRDKLTRLWLVDTSGGDSNATSANRYHLIANNTRTIAAAAMQHGGGDSTADTVAFLHAAMGSPPLSTFITAIEKGYVDLPAISITAVKRYKPRSLATAKGHLDQTRQGQRSTDSASNNTFLDEETIKDMFPDRPQLPVSQTRRVLIKIVEARKLPTGQNHTDLSGRFLVASARGHEYLMVMLSEDANYIHVEPMKNRLTQSFVAAYTDGINFFRSRGFNPVFERMDNETSAELQRYLKQSSITVQYVAPHQHRANKAERAIRTFKNHFIAILSGTDPDFPLSAWDLLLPQAELTLNMMRGSTVNPYISAYQQLHGHFDFGKTPLAPPGIKVLIHEKPQQRATWAPHGIEGWYVGPALQHYRCYDVLAKATNRIRTTDTLSWHPPRALALPGARPIDILAARMDDLATELQSIHELAPSLIDHRDILATPTATLAEAISTLHSIFIKPAGTASIQRVVVEAVDERLTTTHRPPVVANDEHNHNNTVVAVPQPQMVKESQHSPPAVMATSDGTASLPSQRPTHTSPVIIAQPPGLSPTHQSSATEALPLSQQQVTTTITKRRTKSPAARNKASRRQHKKARNQQQILPPTPRTAVAKRGGKRRKESTVATYKLRNRELAAAAMDIVIDAQPENYRTALRGPDRDKWLQAHSEEITRLVDETECIKFIRHTSKPRNKPASYYNPQVKVKVKNGTLVYRVRGTYGGNKQTFNGKKDAQTAALPTVKILLNSVVSDDADWMTIDIADFYPTKGNKLDEPEFMWIELNTLPEDIIVKYNLRSLAHNGKVLVQIDSALYGLRQAGRVAQDRLIKHLADNGYHQCQNTPCLFKHEQLPITFSLVVDDFGIKYKGKETAQHLLDTLQRIYRITADWKGERFIGMTINHDKTNRTLSVSMPNYVQKALVRFAAEDIQTAKSPAIYVPPVYGSRKQQRAVIDSSEPITCAKRKKRIQQIIGTLLYYARAVDPTMLTALNKVASRQANPTIAVEQAAERILSYAKTFPNAQIVYEASDMILCGHSDASYLSETKARSRSGGIFFLSNKNPTQHNINGSIECISSIIPAIVASAAEAEYGALFQFGQVGEGIRATLEDMGHPQPPTRIYSDNKCAVSIANGEAKQKLSKAFDMKFHWIKSRVSQQHFQVVWARGSDNLADIFTKALSAKDHVALRSNYVQDRAELPNSIKSAREA